MIEIEKNIPIPAARYKGSKVPIQDMQVGDSFYVPFNPEAPGYLRWNPSAGISSIVSKYLKMGWEFTRRKDDTGGVRVWRIK